MQGFKEGRVLRGGFSCCSYFSPHISDGNRSQTANYVALCSFIGCQVNFEQGVTFPLFNCNPIFNRHLHVCPHLCVCEGKSHVGDCVIKYSACFYRCLYFAGHTLVLGFSAFLCVCFAVSHLRVHKTSLAGKDLCLHSAAHWYDSQQ